MEEMILDFGALMGKGEGLWIVGQESGTYKSVGAYIRSGMYAYPMSDRLW